MAPDRLHYLPQTKHQRLQDHQRHAESWMLDWPSPSQVHPLSAHCSQPTEETKTDKSRLQNREAEKSAVPRTVCYRSRTGPEPYNARTPDWWRDPAVGAVQHASQGDGPVPAWSEEEGPPGLIRWDENDHH